MSLVQCKACERHVHIDEARCPFCDVPIGETTPRPTGHGNISRAAALALGAAIVGGAALGCGDETTSSSSDGNGGAAQGAGASTTTGGAGPGATGGGGGNPSSGPQGGFAAPYGHAPWPPAAMG